MATPPGRSDGSTNREQVGRAWHVFIVTGRRVMISTYVVLAVLGAAIAPPEVTLLWGPVLGAVGVGVVWLVAPDFKTDRGSRKAAWTAGAAGLLMAPFAAGLSLLGHAGAVVLVALFVMGALSVVDAILGTPVDAPGAARRHLVYLRRVLPELPVESLVREWRASAAALRRAADPETRAVTAELRAELLDELARRDPELVSRWLEYGDGGSDQAVPGGAP